MEKIKLFIEGEKGRDILIIIIVILVGLASFELGRLSKQNSTNGIKIEYQDQGANALNAIENTYKPQNKASTSQTATSGNYFASSRGTKYYSINCSAGKTLKQENRIYFSTSLEAEKAGYTLSSACK